MSSDKNVSWITNYIWGIADDVLRDLYKRGEYRDIILALESEPEGLLEDVIGEVH